LSKHKVYIYLFEIIFKISYNLLKEGIKLNNIINNNQLKTRAKKDLNDNWLTSILLLVTSGVIPIIIIQIPYLGGIINSFIAGPLLLGVAGCFLNLIRCQEFRVENLFNGFSNFKSAFMANLLRGLFIFLWSLLLVIPGIIVQYNYSMTFYILNDNPQLSGKEAIAKSKDLMDGHKIDLLFLQFSFAGWPF
jgi:uncharacterized membrane protein